MDSSTLVFAVLTLIAFGVWGVQFEIRRLIRIVLENSGNDNRTSYTSSLDSIKYEIQELNEKLSLLKDKYLEEGRWEPGEKVSIRLRAVHPEKIRIIKILRDHTKIGLKEAKDLTDQTPSIIFTGGKNRAERLMSELTELGASVEMVEVNGQSK
jgi:ribosomal protein L7/L12